MAAAIAGLPVEAQNTNKAPAQPKAAEKKTSSEKKEATPKSPSPIPFRGHLLDLNKTARTIKLDKRTLEITSETKIYRGDKPAALEDGVKGEYITGSYKKADDGKLIARSLYFGGKNKEKSSKEKGTEKKAEK